MNKKNRIKKNADFSRVFQEGSSTANRQFVIYTLKKEDQKQFRIGLSVSKKLGNAVERNHIKRYIRQALTELSDDLRVNMDYVVIARKPCTELPFNEFKKSLIHVLKRAEALKIRDSKHKLDKNQIK
ncbi:MULTISPECIES: ribonuclease P protein component [Bacillaceae]|jgi:ribonuclease P protein component|uniref:Ribonuclease P protein component n=1 Tax=Gottfriedia acidiceleris TaxID=371036 RepID=A0ABY4JMC9_9BACI|nr:MULTISPECIES: ribonuclease P protein component [Bacillaceae]PEC49441.1 ribonuclease P protein component [Bacillus sp. AFS096315]PET68534.1 ribonuclease P protein component [Bacillus sp. AFS001701]PFM82163.1 ribonuclease P protein component [Bacillus sp. AFS077874]UPM54369.1 ribonuclease P protein component [Gottfriedia acidiceleris]